MTYDFILFNCTLEEIFRNLYWEGIGLIIEGKNLSNLSSADVVSVSENFKDRKKMLMELVQKSREAGLEINFKKQKYFLMKRLQTH